ncbi:acyl-ACP thioesterase, partial [Nocardia salmonicida]
VPESLIETESFCIKVDFSGQPSRISDAAQQHMSRHVENARLRWQTFNTVVPPVDCMPGHPFTLRSSDIDAFNHMNNAVYWQVLENELASHPDVIEGSHRAIVEFLRPIPPGAEITTRICHQATQLQIWLILDDTVAASAHVFPYNPTQDNT